MATHTQKPCPCCSFWFKAFSYKPLVLFFQEISFEKGAGVSLEKGCSRTPLKKDAEHNSATGDGASTGRGLVA
jgi:hypothetical protein